MSSIPSWLSRHTPSAINGVSLEAANALWTNSAQLVRGARVARGELSMIKLVKSIGHGLLAAGVFLIVVYFVGIYFKGSDALRDALDPLASRNYLVLIVLMPGALLFWLADYIAARRRRTSSAEVFAPGAPMDTRTQRPRGGAPHARGVPSGTA